MLLRIVWKNLQDSSKFTCTKCGKDYMQKNARNAQEKNYLGTAGDVDVE